MKLISSSFFLLVLVTFVFYSLFPKRQRWIVLLISSLAFYLCAGLFSFIIVLIFSLSSYLFALLIKRRDRQEGEFVARSRERENKKRKKKKSYYVCIFSAFLLLSLWVVIRRVSPSVALGISFYSLRVVSYLYDVQKGRVEPQKNLLKYTLFVTFFPLAYLGPVALYRDISDQLYCGRKASADEITSGLFRITWGIFKKLVVANSLSLPLSLIASSPERYSGVYVLFLLVFYSAEIYCDFSGGIDISSGVGALFGIDLPENFLRPFASANLREFWNRWHITLGEWFEAYVFYPISLSSAMQRLSKKCRKIFGTRYGKRLPLYASTMFTWLLTGLWHGGQGHFIAWGLINGALVLVSQELSRPMSRFLDKHPRLKNSAARLLFGRVRVFLIIGAVRLLDVYESLPLTARMLLSVFLDVESYKSFFGGGIFALFKPSSLVVVLVAIFFVFLLGFYAGAEKNKPRKAYVSVTLMIFLTLSALVFGTYGMGYDASDFIYSHFNT